MGWDGIFGSGRLTSGESLAVVPTKGEMEESFQRTEGCPRKAVDVRQQMGRSWTRSKVNFQSSIG